MTKSTFLWLGTLSICALGAVYSSKSSAQGYPAKSVRMIVTLAPGGAVDGVARLIAARLSEQLGQQFIVDNRPGAGGSVGGEAVARAPADGHTLLMGSQGTIAVSPHLITNLPYDAQRDLTPVSLVVTSPLALVVHPSLPAHTVKEFVAIARARPGAINFASSGIGSTGHLAVELLKVAAKIDMVHVPYKGAAPALNDLVGGQTQMQITAVSGTMPFIKSGRLRALGVTSPRRVPVLPHLPTIGEALPGYEVISWYGVFTTAGTPASVISRLHAEVVKAVSHPEVNKRLRAAGFEPGTNSPDEFTAMVRSESAKWDRLIKTLNIRR